MKKRITFRDLLVLQAVVVVYTFAGILGKIAAGQAAGGFFLIYCLQVAVLGIYALLWQQVIKRFELSVAYVNRAAALAWSLLWAVLVFGEQITVKKLAGVAFVILGTLVVNSEFGTVGAAGGSGSGEPTAVSAADGTDDGGPGAAGERNGNAV